MANFSVILAAAGKSSRFNDPAHKKPYIHLNQKPVWLHSAERFMNRDDVGQLIVVIAKEDQAMFSREFAANVAAMGIDVVVGGAERADSVQNALDQVHAACDFVAIHDAARPCVTDEDIENVFVATEKTGAAILATPVTSTVKKSVDGKSICETVDRRELWLGQTPQCFGRELIQKVYRGRGDFKPTDEAQLVERSGTKVTLVEGSPLNIKLTTKADLIFAESCIKAMPMPTIDSRPFGEDKLWR
jgi:2-C-methyl-D-erythritol 4-phosphate cytidylyltransferase